MILPIVRGLPLSRGNLISGVTPGVKQRWTHEKKRPPEGVRRPLRAYNGGVRLPGGSGRAAADTFVDDGVGGVTTTGGVDGLPNFSGISVSTSGRSSSMRLT